MKVQQIWLVAGTAWLTGCTHAASQSPPPRQFAPSTLIYQTQVSNGPCVGEVEAVGFLATLAGAVISQGVNRIGKAIEEAARTDTQTALARRNLEMTAAGLGECVYVARGWFHRSNPAAPDFPMPLERRFAFLSKSAFPVTNLETVGDLWRTGLFMAATPDFYFQGRLVPNSTRTAYTVLPILATLDRPIASNQIRSDRRSVTISFALAAGGASAVQNGSTVVLGRIEPGRLAEFPEGTCVVASGGEPELKACPSKKDETIVRVVRTAFESEWFSPAMTSELKPMTLLAQVSETRDESRFLAFVAALFNDVKAPITTGLQHALVPELGADAAEAEITAAEAAANTHDKAVAGAVSALKECIAAPADVTKRTNARVALRGLIAAARKADMPAAVTEGHVDAITVNGSDAQPCTAALQAIQP